MFKAILLAIAGFVTFASIANGATGAPDVQRYFVKFKVVLTQEQIVERLTAAGLVLEHAIPEIGVYVAATNNPIQAEQVGVPQLENSPDVAYVDRDRVVHALESEDFDQELHPYLIPNDPQYPLQAEMRRIDPENAWNISIGSSKVLVATSDTGMSMSHVELKNQLWTNPGEIPDNSQDDDHNGYIDDVHGWNFVSNNNNPGDDEGHGTHVAGIIGAEGNNGIGITGVNWRVKIMPVKFLDASGSGTLEGGVQSILYAVSNGAKLINASWGSSGSSPTLHDAIEYAYSHGTLLIAASANDSADTDVSPNYPSADPSLGVLAVASSSGAGQLSSFSNFGITTVDLVAPGSNILSTYLNNGYVRMSGTSMATPMITGVGALMLSVNPDLSVLELRNGLINAVDERTGYGGKISSSGDVNARLAVQQLQAGFQVWPSRLTLPLNYAYPMTAYHASGSVQWSVSNPGIANITPDGVVTFFRNGEVKVIAKDSTGNTASTAWARTPGQGGGGGGGGGGCGRRHIADPNLPSNPYETTGALASMSLPFVAGWLVRRRRR